LLLSDQTTIDAHPVSYLQSFHLRNVNNSLYHQIPLLFPISRTQGLKKQITGTLEMMYRAMDYLPRTYDAYTNINTATAMILPLQAVIYVPSTSSLVLPLKVKKMMVSDVFQYDSRINFVHWKDTRDPSLLTWKLAPKAIFKGLASGGIKFQPFFVSVCSPAPLESSEVSFAPLVDQFYFTDEKLIVTPSDLSQIVPYSHCRLHDSVSHSA
jgi:hypothetical protein